MVLPLTIDFLRVLTYSIIFFGFIWWVAKEFDNWSIVDAFWAYFFGAMCMQHLVTHPFELNNSTNILLVLVLVWSVRLGTHLALRIFKDLRHEDGRYIKMRQEWAKDLNWKMFQFYMLQALAFSILCTPIISSILHEDKSLHWIHWVGIVVTVLALVGEAVADLQLKNFKAASAKGAVCDTGLWAWTRHPNYFFEWLIWVGFALLSYNNSFYAIPGILCAGFMYYLLTRVSGVSMTEKQLTTSKGESYKIYQSAVPAFWPKKPKRKIKA